MTFKSLLMSSALGVMMLAPGAGMARDLTVAIQNNLTGLDPTNVNDTLSQTSLRLIYQGLFGFDPEMNLVPLLAESYDSNEDATEFTIKLRSGVTFHDGTAFNADAVKVNLDRLRNPDNNLSRRSLVSMIDDVTVVDDLTVKLTLDAPFGAMIASLAHPGAMMISPAALEEYGPEIGRHPVGTGAFKFENWSADTLEVTRNDDYWKGPAKVEHVIIRSVPESGARMAMLQTGEAQFVPNFPPELMQVVENNPNLKVEVSPSIVEFYVALNNNKAPLDNKLVRQALNYAVDKDAFCQVVFSGLCTPADSIIPSGLAFHTTAGEYAYDLDRARELMAEAGVEDGFSTEIWANSNTESLRAVQFIQQQLAQINVDVTVVPLEAGVAAQRIWSIESAEDAEVQMYYGGWSSSTGDADWGIRPLLLSENAPPSMFNVAYYSDPELDAAITGAIGTANPDERAGFYETAQKLAWEGAPWIFLGVADLIAAQTADVTGVHMLPDRGFLLEDAAFTE
ncbi:glutathione ABC transporter substrate-binding protein [Falsirhodobacter halotolerans]|uniref:glutathione ABC transporter substrate-binding protein n=1 Tax=Falsirhodobacter halotolerans TaxID=1146892 RepID=UPI001FD40970|nr:glutathione ABC transporter substrate-binding protein [Falsirhodobacter halotolerans]MCJ8140904.1 glutathione ABC transporter substrate-binding protein [Falsirhodobacter halotolerans]